MNAYIDFINNFIGRVKKYTATFCKSKKKYS